MIRKRVLIMGGAGFLGSHLCDYYIGAGWDVVCVDNECIGCCENIEYLIDNFVFIWWYYDVIMGLELLGELYFLLYMVLFVSLFFYKCFLFEMLEVGVVGIWCCLELVEKKGVRFVFVFISEVYGDFVVLF